MPQEKEMSSICKPAFENRFFADFRHVGGDLLDRASGLCRYTLLCDNLVILIILRQRPYWYRQRPDRDNTWGFPSLLFIL